MNDASKTLGVIGTAGGREAAGKVTRASYDAAYADLLTELGTRGATSLVSGGAAFADHLAVRAFLAGAVRSLTLHLPCGFDAALARYGAGGDGAELSNALHDGFRRSTGVESLREIGEAASRGARVVAGGGFLVRNGRIGEDADDLAAYVFVGMRPRRQVCRKGDCGHGDPEVLGLGRSGTASGWRRSRRAGVKTLVNLDPGAREAQAYGLPLRLDVR